MIAHLVTDRRRLADDDGSGEAGLQHCLLRQIQYAVEAGVDVVQVRERDLEARALAALVRAVVALARGSSTRIVVNERADVALAAGADGVHLRDGSVSAASLRRLTPPGFLIGRSVHDVAAAAAAGRAVDYLMAGTVRATPSKPADHRLLGLDGFAAIAAAAAVPVLAIGGVSVDDAPALGQAGAAGVAGIGLFFDPACAGCRSVNLNALVARIHRPV